MIFEIQDSGELLEIQDANFTPKNNAVYIFVTARMKMCFLWFGKNSGVRKQFIAANEARKIKLDTGYRTTNVQHEGSDHEFEEALRLWKKDMRGGVIPAAVIEEQRKRIKEMQEDISDIYPSTGVQVENKKDEIDSKIKSIPLDSDISKILKKLSKFDPIEKHTRDYIVTIGHVFSTTQVNNKVDIELLDKVKNGMFEVENYLSRFLIEDSRLIAIELWRIPR